MTSHAELSDALGFDAYPVAVHDDGTLESDPTGRAPEWLSASHSDSHDARMIEYPAHVRREYVDARERGESVSLALSRARAELASNAVLTVTDAADDAPYGGFHDVYDVNPRELRRVTSDPRYATSLRRLDDGRYVPAVVPLDLPDGATVRVYVYDDAETAPSEFESYDDETLEAWERDAWRYVGVSAVVTLWDGRRGENAVWGVEQGDFFPGSDEAQIWHAVPDEISGALDFARLATPDAGNIPDADRATCGSCGRSWNATTYPTPVDRCPWEADHDEPSDGGMLASLDGTDDAADWLTPGHVLDASEVEFLRALRLPAATDDGTLALSQLSRLAASWDARSHLTMDVREAAAAVRDIIEEV